MPIPLSVAISGVDDLSVALAACADGAILEGGLELAPACARAGLRVVAVRISSTVPHEAAPPLLPAASPPTLILLPPPRARPEDTRSIERVKAFRLATLEALQSIGEWAREQGHTVAIASRANSFFEGALELTEIIRAARQSSLRYTLNTFDAEASGDTVSGATDITADLLGHVVAEDALNGQRAAPGRGRLDLGRLLEELELLGYAGAVEVAGRPEEWADSIEFLRRVQP